jgi:hypothetical protein
MDRKIKLVLDINGKPLPTERQLDWREAAKQGLRPSSIRFIEGEPFAVFADGSGIYGPCPRRKQWRDDGR